MKSASDPLFPRLANYLDEIEPRAADLPAERKRRLEGLAEYIRSKREGEGTAALIFICTHNSRRSLMAQLWAVAVAAHKKVGGLTFYSGGTESTAFHPHAIQAMRDAGFDIPESSGTNPHYAVRFSKSAPPVDIFSKTFDHLANPRRGFAAVMTCAEADADCPIVLGAEERFSLPYADPKSADGSPQAGKVYAERCRQIAVEMAYLIERSA